MAAFTSARGSINESDSSVSLLSTPVRNTSFVTYSVVAATNATSPFYGMLVSNIKPKVAGTKSVIPSAVKDAETRCFISSNIKEPDISSVISSNTTDPETNSVISSNTKDHETCSVISSNIKEGPEKRSVILSSTTDPDTMSVISYHTKDPETSGVISSNKKDHGTSGVFLSNTMYPISSDRLLATYKVEEKPCTDNNQFTCNTCDKSFRYKSQLYRHAATHLDKKSRPFKCDFCERSFMYPYRLKQHRIKHTGVIPLDCKYCNETFTDKTEFDKHMALHSGLKKYFCKICLSRFSKREYLTSHMKTHSGHKPFECGVCQKSFLLKEGLQRHQSQVHFQSGRVECKICQKILSCKSALRLHIKKHTLVKDYTCDLCGKTFYDSQNMKNHIVSHLGLDQQRTCTICGKHLLKTSLKSHMAKHNLNGQEEASGYVSCDLCGKVLANKNNLAIHMETHTRTKEDSVTCKICGKEVTSVYLASHMRRHGGKICKCKVCGKAFVTPGDLRRHMTIHTGEMPYSCPICSRSFNCSSNMIRHKRYFHDEVKLFECKVCGRKVKNMTRHLKSKLHTRSVQLKSGE